MHRTFRRLTLRGIYGINFIQRLIEHRVNQGAIYVSVRVLRRRVIVTSVSEEEDCSLPNCSCIFFIPLRPDFPLFGIRAIAKLATPFDHKSPPRS